MFKAFLEWLSKELEVCKDEIFTFITDDGRISIRKDLLKEAITQVNKDVNAMFGLPP